MAQKPRDVDVDRSDSFKGLTVSDPVTPKPTESAQEKAQRLHKELLGFYIKDLAVWILALFSVAAAWVFCFVILAGSGWSPAEKDRAWTAFMAITTGAIGVLFGKQLGK